MWRFTKTGHLVQLFLLLLDVWVACFAICFVIVTIFALLVLRILLMSYHKHLCSMTRRSTLLYRLHRLWFRTRLFSHLWTLRTRLRWCFVSYCICCCPICIIDSAFGDWLSKHNVTLTVKSLLISTSLISKSVSRTIGYQHTGSSTDEATTVSSL